MKLFFKNGMLYFLTEAYFSILYFKICTSSWKIDFFCFKQTNVLFCLKKCNFVTGILLPVYKNYYSSQIWQEQIPVFFICAILGKEIVNTSCSSSFNYGNCNVHIPLHIVNRSELIVTFYIGNLTWLFRIRIFKGWDSYKKNLNVLLIFDNFSTSAILNHLYD